MGNCMEADAPDELPMKDRPSGNSSFKQEQARLSSPKRGKARQSQTPKPKGTGRVHGEAANTADAHKLRICAVGDGTIGKSSLLLRLQGALWDPATQGMSQCRLSITEKSFSAEVTVGGATVKGDVQLEFIDTAGQAPLKTMIMSEVLR